MIRRSKVPFQMMTFATLLVIFATSLPASDLSDLELLCRPIHAQQDFRAIRPEYAQAPPSFTFYLFENRDLLHYKVELVNNGPKPIELGNLDWPNQLEISVRHEETSLPVDGVRLTLLRRTLLDVVYYLEGRRIEQVDFRRRASGFGSEPLQKTNDSRREIHEVNELPILLETYQQAGVEIALSGPDGELLPAGDYRVNFHDPQTGKSCDSEHLIIMRQPESGLDKVESRVVRYRYLKSLGDMESAYAELRQACEEVPDSLTAWYTLASHAAAVDDLDLQLEAAEKLRFLRRERGSKPFPDSTTIQALSRDAVNNLDEIRLKAEAAHAEKGKNIVGGEDEIE